MRNIVPGPQALVAARRHLLLLAVAAIALPSAAQTKAADPAAAAGMTDGEVRKVSKDSGKITLKHGEIRSLDMPPMTMVFQVKDAALLDKVKAGDKVRFAAEKGPGGAFVVTEIEVRP